MPNAKLSQLVLLIIVAGCTTQPAKDHGADHVSAAGPDVQCHSQQLTGSMINKTVCTTRAEREAQRAAVSDLQNSLSMHGGNCANAQGCP